MEKEKQFGSVGENTTETNSTNPSLVLGELGHADSAFSFLNIPQGTSQTPHF